jgi:hypothetical protein
MDQFSSIVLNQVDPCSPPPEGTVLLPRGSGFVTGVEKKGASTPNTWHGWKFLVTAKHVLAGQNEIVIRVNTEGESKFACKKIKLEVQARRRT